MPIFVTTGGPISSMPSVLQPQIRTFSDMIDVISDELDDTGHEYFLQIQKAVLSALRFCEREPFYFNESRDVIFATAEGRAWYDSTDATDIGTLAGLASVWCEEANGQTVLLRRETPEMLERLSGDHADNPVRGRPQYYAYFARKLRLHPVPDRNSYRIRLVLSPARLDRITSATEENPWFREASELIKARAKYELYRDILKDAPLAMAAFDDFSEQLHALRAETSRRNGTGKLRATGF